MNECVCDNCTVSYSGGAISMARDGLRSISLNVSNSSFIGARGYHEGGTIRASQASLFNCMFRDSVCISGGAISASEELLVTDCTFQGSEADKGGVILCAHYEIYGSTFTNCRASKDGGVVSTQGENAIIEQCVFRNCSSRMNGGVIACSFGDKLSVRIATSSFSGCEAGAYGGILSIVSQNSMGTVNSVQVVNCTAEDVLAEGHTGEIIYSNMAPVECMFENNVLSVCKRGGYAGEYAVWIPVTSTQSLSVCHCVFSGSKDDGVTLKQFFCWSGAAQHIEYINCTFENMKQGSNF